MDDEILSAARRLVEEGGEEALTMDRLAQLTGRSRSTLYRQTGGREKLLEQLSAQDGEGGDRPQLRDRILAAARAVFARRGLEEATMEAVAEEAQVGPATLYRHFGDKQGLIKAFLAMLGARRTAWAIAREPSGDLELDLLRMARSGLEDMRSNEAVLRIGLMEQLKGSQVMAEQVRSPQRTIYALAAVMEPHITRGTLIQEEPLRLARAFLGLLFIFGVFGTIWGLPGGGDPERDARLVVRIFLNGVKAEAPRSAGAGGVQ